MSRVSGDSREQDRQPGKKELSIPPFLPLEQKIQLWNSQYPKEAELAKKMDEIIGYEHKLGRIMIGQPTLLRSLVVLEKPKSEVTRVREGIDAWLKLGAFLDRDGRKILDRYTTNREYLNDGEFDAHKAWVFSMKGSARQINEAHKNMGTVIGSLQDQGYGPSHLESRHQAARAAVIRHHYNDLLSIKLGISRECGS